jgi:truncated hemoglobin YjbI
MGNSDWTALARKMRTHYQINKRSGKQCRERWYNCLNRSINKAGWSEEEDRQLLRLQGERGSKWT